MSIRKQPKLDLDLNLNLDMYNIQGSITKTYDGGQIQQQYSKSSSKRLFQSVFKIIDYDQYQTNQFQQEQQQQEGEQQTKQYGGIEYRYDVCRKNKTQLSIYDNNSNSNSIYGDQYMYASTSMTVIDTSVTVTNKLTSIPTSVSITSTNPNPSTNPKSTNPTTKPRHKQLTNGNRILQILNNQYFNTSIYNKLKQQNLINNNLYLYPILKVQCRNNKGIIVSLEKQDILNVFNKFGYVYTICQNNSNNGNGSGGSGNNNSHNGNVHSYYILYTSFSRAYVAMKLMNKFVLRHTLAQLSVQWCRVQQYVCSQIIHVLHDYYNHIEWYVSSNNNGSGNNGGHSDEDINGNSNGINSNGISGNGDMNVLKMNRKQSSMSTSSITSHTSNTSNNNNNNNNNQSSSSLLSKQCKLTCRYDIQIQNQKDFQVARRIIGSKGINMKKIIQSTLDKVQQYLSSTSTNTSTITAMNINNINPNQLLKLRLRGRGSGYKQGPQQLQSQQQLHLCISAKDQLIYMYACESVERLLMGVYQEYQEWTRKQGSGGSKGCVLGIKKYQIGTSNNSNNNNGSNNANVVSSSSNSSCSSSLVINSSYSNTNTSMSSTCNVLTNITNNININTNTNTMITNNNTNNNDIPSSKSNNILNSIINNTNNNQNIMLIHNLDNNNSARMQPDKIQQYLQLRNKARRQLNFIQADRIRNYLRSCGVCLIDQKGRRGKAAQVTAWKYMQ